MLAGTAFLFDKAARQVRALLACSCVGLVLGCADGELRHPLLALFSWRDYRTVSFLGATPPALLLQDRHVHALCDLALQTGHMQNMNHAPPGIGATGLRSIAIVPLERPAGILGYFLLADVEPDAFSPGECLLLRHFLPHITEAIENNLRAFCDQSSTATSDPPAPVLRPDPEERVAACAQELAHVSVQLKELDQLKHELISMIGHEFRAPLTAIKGYAVLLQAYGISEQSDEIGEDDNELTPLRQREYLDIIMEQVNHLEVLISDLLDISRMHAGRLALHMAPIEIAHVCHRVAALIQKQVNQAYPHAYSIHCVLAPGLPRVLADVDRVQQVLTNLLENAVKYSPNGGLIEIIAHETRQLSSAEAEKSEVQTELARAPELVSITVRDQGIGIPVHEQDRLFQPFSRLDHPLTQQVTGAGLGLYITHTLVEAMHGHVSLASVEGEGTSVTFTLPVAASAQDAITVADTFNAPAAESERLTVSSK